MYCAVYICREKIYKLPQTNKFYPPCFNMHLVGRSGSGVCVWKYGMLYYRRYCTQTADTVCFISVIVRKHTTSLLRRQDLSGKTSTSARNFALDKPCSIIIHDRIIGQLMEWFCYGRTSVVAKLMEFLQSSIERTYLFIRLFEVD